MLIGIFYSQIVESLSLVSVLFREAISHPYISFFHLLVNGFSVIYLESKHNIYIHMKLTKNPMHWQFFFRGGRGGEAFAPPPPPPLRILCAPLSISLIYILECTACSPCPPLSKILNAALIGTQTVFGFYS